MPMSKAGRRAISEAQRRRWAKFRAARLQRKPRKERHSHKEDIMKAFRTVGRYLRQVV